MARIRQGAVARQVQALFDAGTVGGLTDGQLLERFATRGGESAELAFAALVERHGPMVLRTCRAVLRDLHDAHDAFQATFLVLVRRAGTLRAGESLGPWLYQVAYRTASCARSAAARRSRHERRSAERIRPSVRERAPDDLGEVLHEELARLAEPFRSAVVLCLVDGLTHEQAARRLGWPVGTVESRLARGRERLRTRLIGRGLTPGVAAIATAASAGRARAAVPAALAEATVRAAVRISMGRATVAEAVSASVWILARGMSRDLSMTIMKLAGAAVLAIGLMATGAGVWANRRDRTDERAAPAAPIPAGRPARPAPAVVARVDGTPITRDDLIERCLEKYGAKELETLIALKLLDQAGARRGIVVTPEDLEAEAETVADRLGLKAEEWYRTLEKERGMTKPDYLRDVLYPAVMLRRLEAAEPAASFDSLRRAARVERFLKAPRRDERAAEPARAGARSQEDRLRAIERRLDETIQALDRLRREVGR